MRLGLLISDYEYRKALAARLSECDKDILIDIMNASDSADPEALIITDAKPAGIDQLLLKKIQNRTVFISSDLDLCKSKTPLNCVFKYESTGRLLADIYDFYAKWKGISISHSPKSVTVACCFDNDNFSSSRCSRLARQIMYTQGGSVLLLPLGYINDKSLDYNNDINRFAKLMYDVRKDKLGSSETISYTDSYGISRLMLPAGRNPIAYLEDDDLCKLIMALSNVFDNIILDISCAYRPENLNAIKNADAVLCFESRQRKMIFESLPVKDDDDKLHIISINNDGDEDFAIDEFVRALYGIKDEFDAE